MDRNNEQDKISGAKITVKSPFGQWLENFLYHYKWHTVIALVLAFAIIMCSVQMCTKTEFDAYVLYAGGTNIRETASQGDISDKQKITSALMQYCEDYNGDGERRLDFLNLFMPSDEEIEKIQQSGEWEVNFALVSQNNEAFKNHMYFGRYQICFLSEHLYMKWTEDKENTPIAPIAPYLPEGSELRVAQGGYGVYLKSSPLAEKAGFNIMSEDTVICIRRMSLMSESFDKSENEEYFKRSEEILRKLLDA